MSDESREADVDESNPFAHFSQPRRRFLRAAAAAGVLSSAATAAAQEEEGEADIVLDGETPGWEGVEPEEIAGETNPTLSLVEGETYTLEWENVDGDPHNFVIEDPDENTLVETEVISERGATQTVEFEATREMSEYYCAVHPVSMRGEIDLGAAPDEEPAEEGAEERFFPEGASVGVQTVAEGMTAPTDFAVPPGDDDRMFVTDQTGEVWIVDENGRREEPFLDVADRMVAISEEFAGSYADPESDYDERGLLGIEFHPDYEENGRFFVNYSASPEEETPDGWSHVQIISEFRVPEGADGQAEAADPDSERRILEFQSPQYNHNSGPLAFGPDGYLYVPMGDGGGANDSMYGHVDDWYDENEGGNGQDTTQNLLGGIHRIDVDADEGEDGRAYGIPDDNPLVDEEDHLDEYYAWGFRNPFGISFDRDDRLMVADAGQALFESAYEVEMGGNYSWNVKEGTHCFSTESPDDPPEECPDRTPDDVRGGEELLDPVVEYPQNFQGRKLGIVIVGGHVYEGDALEDLQGKYIFGDWTQDAARQTPRGRVFAATVPDYGEADGGDAVDDDGDEAGPDTEENGAAGDGDDGMDQDGDENGPEEDDAPVPTDDLWELEELMFEGGENREINRFVRQFGRDRDGEVYVLVSEAGVPQGETGAVMQLVPPEEGEDVPPSEAAEEEEETPEDDEMPEEEDDEMPEEEDGEMPEEEDGEMAGEGEDEEAPEDGGDGDA